MADYRMVFTFLYGATFKGGRGLDEKVAPILAVSENYWLHHSQETYKLDQNLCTPRSRSGSGIERNNPSPVWYRTPVLRIFTLLNELPVTSTRKKHIYIYIGLYIYIYIHGKLIGEPFQMMACIYGLNI